MLRIPNAVTFCSKFLGKIPSKSFRYFSTISPSVKDWMAQRSGCEVKRFRQKSNSELSCSSQIMLGSLSSVVKVLSRHTEHWYRSPITSSGSDGMGKLKLGSIECGLLAMLCRRGAGSTSSKLIPADRRKAWLSFLWPRSAKWPVHGIRVCCWPVFV